ncbi:MAG: putative DNA binding domain-containing protein [Candidatus Thiodiazotropha lotti]|nr:putative DNA binding domain-containing protein [Candidatus Thiodiazotropha lotti]MCW4222489.1 putative DNA binding domain-containing protein [Candidatus Thiodiazotropha lotti]
MLEITTLDDIAALSESCEIECKLAQGRDGKGALPKTFWETYSAFANTHGGDVFLGLKERKDKSFELEGIEDPQKVMDELWTGLNNPQKVSGNILRERWVKVLEIDGKHILQVHVPQAPRKQKPVYIKGNPITGTYRRYNSTDQHQSEEAVRRMLAEQVEESRDSEILKGYGIDDLAFESLSAYRQIYVNRQPDHPWNQNDAQEFLYNIGAWGKDREAGHSGLTRAGLLMFGRLRAIKEAFPNYMLDYQERPEAKTEARWVDRFTLDGSWSGNLFDFYRQVIRKLTADLKVPFQMEGDQRLDDTPVHKALREALVNTLVHADYSGRASILVVKRPDMFGFRNPGLMRVPVDIAISGGESDCRNRLLQDMFRFIGLGESAGSGLPKIFHGWSSQHWREPALREKMEPSEQTLLELHMLSLVPEKVLSELRIDLGEAVFEGLSENERLVLVTAHIETTVDHGRMMSILDIHPRDLTALFSGLVEKGLLKQNGSGRGTVYFLPATPAEAIDLGSGGLGASSGGLTRSSGGLDDLEAIASAVASKKKTPKTLVESTILQLCQAKPLTLEELSQLLHRSVDSIRKDYLQPMIRDKRLRYRYPTSPQHPEQAYITNEERKTE